MVLNAFVICILCYNIVNVLAVTEQGCDDYLVLTSFIKNGRADVARSLSLVDSSHFCGIISHSGFITVNEKYNSNLFFWYFPHEGHSEKTPWIIWLQGGPGYSSLKGLFDINGPLQVVNGTVQLRNITWASNYSMLFLDNPVGAGYSFTTEECGYPSDEDAVGEQMYEFLQQFLEVFPELRKAPLFLAGESYAGKYVPALGIQIHRHKQNSKFINFMGFIVGNGLIDPRSVMHYSEICRVTGILDDGQLKKIEQLEKEIVKLIDEKKLMNASNKFNQTVELIKKYSGVNIYNYLKNPIPTNSAPDFELFVTRPGIRKAIHVGNLPFHLNNQLVYQKMLSDIMNSTKPFVEELLEHYDFLSYSGQLDVIVAYSMAKYTYKSLYWSGRDEYMHAKRVRVRDAENGAVVAYKKSGGNFVEVLIRGAGHMVPVEKPAVTKYLIDTFISDVINKKQGIL